ncbi:MAG: polymorphic toxin type 50 domain-containing protein [Defluviitaleaceae bacterium]|nr:polymorphic toxin type 50 domain-containing protein [Defluviitaleaceae bacterium]
MKSEQAKILDGTYPSRLKLKEQAKHIYGSTAFQREVAINLLKKANGEDYFMPAYFNVDENLQDLVDTYKGTGFIVERKGADYPWEYIKLDRVIGQAWDPDNEKYVDTYTFVIVYSRRGVHIFPQGPMPKIRRLFT